MLGARDSVVTVETNLDLLPLFFTLPQWHGADVPTKITDRVQALGLVPDGCTLTNPAKSGAAAKNSTDCLQAAKENYLSKCNMGQCGAAVGYVYSELFELQPDPVGRRRGEQSLRGGFDPRQVFRRGGKGPGRGQ